MQRFRQTQDQKRCDDNWQSPTKDKNRAPTVRIQDVGSNRTGKRRTQGESEPCHQYQSYSVFARHVFGCQCKCVRDHSSKSETDSEAQPHQLRYGVRERYQQGAKGKESQGADNDRFSPYPIGVRRKYLTAENGAQTTSSKN